MAPRIRFCLALHDHQPVGNFDGVIEQAYQDSYRPLMDVLERYPNLRLSLHTSGPLLEWLESHHPEYLERIAGHVAAGRIEIVGGAFYEPILSMLPRRDRIGQIVAFTDWLQAKLGATVRGMWIPERVWEPTLVSDLADAGIEYIVLDDFHFKNAGLVDDQLHGYYLTEDEGRLLKVFPGSERLRYLIPFGGPHETVDYLRGISEQHAGAVVVFGDDGEKFGTWPETKQHVYDNGWLEQFFDALSANSDWLETTTLADAVDHVSPTGKIYLPDASYREMTEWALPVNQLEQYEQVCREMEHDPRWPTLRRFVRGGFWRNFKVKYPESDEMYSRMLMTSRRLEQAEKADLTAERRQLVDDARRELYRGQCNCSYWHGAFGGIYLPHLRNAVYNHLIAADNLLEQATAGDQPLVSLESEDFNLDARKEVRLANDKLFALVAPSRGGQLYELDVRSICHNLLATLMRRPEAYHHKVLAGASQEGDDCASIHDRVVFKQEGLHERVQYDWFPRKSLVDHFYGDDVTRDQVVRGDANEAGDFVLGVYDTTLRRDPGRVQVVLTREGTALGQSLAITKGVTLHAGTSALEIAYKLEGLNPGQRLHFGVEFNFSGLPSGADDRYFLDGEGNRAGQLGSQLDWHEATDIGLVDEWLGIQLGLNLSRPSGIWTFPIETVSQSEGGFELVHQSVVVQPHWYVEADAEGAWSVSMTLDVDTSLAESRMPQETASVSG